MALPGESKSYFPDAYLTKVPEKVQRRETGLLKSRNTNTALLPEELLKITPSFIVHEDDLLYFDYGAVRFGRRPELEGPSQTKLVCVGFGWLPGWEFAVNERGLPDIVPRATRTTDSGEDLKTGVLGLLFKLVFLDKTTSSRLPFSKRKAPNVEDLPCAGADDWTAAVPFHSKLKVLNRAKVYIHVFDGGIGHKYKKDGTIVAFRTPDSPVMAVFHRDPDKLLITREEPKLVAQRWQGEWVGEELRQWIKDAKLPPAYVDQTLRRWLVAGLEHESLGSSGGGLRRFRNAFGF